jgi:hypothetical protein
LEEIGMYQPSGVNKELQFALVSEIQKKVCAAE